VVEPVRGGESAGYGVARKPRLRYTLQDQAIGRVWRIGQERPVHVYKFVTALSIEEDVVQVSFCDCFFWVVGIDEPWIRLSCGRGRWSKRFSSCTGTCTRSELGLRKLSWVFLRSGLKRVM